MPYHLRSILPALLFFWPVLLSGLLLLWAARLADKEKYRLFLWIPLIASGLSMILPILLLFLLAGRGGLYLLLLMWTVSGLMAAIFFLVAYLLLLKKHVSDISSTFKLPVNPFISVSVLVAISLAGSFVGSFYISDQCNQWHMHHAENLIRSLRVYESDQGTFPAQLSEISPAYIAELPEPACLKISETLRDYFRQQDIMMGYMITDCPNHGYILAVTEMLGSGYMRYSFETNQWTRSPGNFLDFPDRLCSGPW